MASLWVGKVALNSQQHVNPNTARSKLFLGHTKLRQVSTFESIRSLASSRESATTSVKAFVAANGSRIGTTFDGKEPPATSKGNVFESADAPLYHFRCCHASISTIRRNLRNDILDFVTKEMGPFSLTA